MKNSLFLVLLFAAGCVLPETHTTVVTQHIFSQEDTSFYFSDCDIKSRADSFELVNITSEMKLHSADDLSKTYQNEIRLLYNWGMGVTYLISLQKNARLTITVIDTTNQNQYSPWLDTIAVQLITTTCWLNNAVYRDLASQIVVANLEMGKMMSSTGATDESVFILEAKLGKKHIIHARFGLNISPGYEEDKAFAAICLQLLHLTDILEKENMLFERLRKRRLEKQKSLNSLLQ